MSKFIFSFGDKKTKKILNSRNILGGKGANLAEMARLGLPVPPGFTISTKMCEIFYSSNKKLSQKICSEIKKELKKIEIKTKKRFGDTKNPYIDNSDFDTKLGWGFIPIGLKVDLNMLTISVDFRKNSSNFVFCCFVLQGSFHFKESDYH